MRTKITMEMSICQAENGFSLDELVKKFADAFENKAFAEILKMNLQLTQEVLIHRIFNNSSSQKCCEDGHLTLNGGFERRIRTSLGEFKMDFWRVRCSKCGKTFAPLAKFIVEGVLILRNSSLKPKMVVDNANLLNYAVSSENISERIKIQTENGFHLKINVCKFRRNKKRPEKQSHRRQLFIIFCQKKKIQQRPPREQGIGIVIQ